MVWFLDGRKKVNKPQDAKVQLREKTGVEGSQKVEQQERGEKGGLKEHQGSSLEGKLIQSRKLESDDENNDVEYEVPEYNPEQNDEDNESSSGWIEDAVEWISHNKFSNVISSWFHGSGSEEVICRERSSSSDLSSSTSSESLLDLDEDSDLPDLSFEDVSEGEDEILTEATEVGEWDLTPVKIEPEQLQILKDNIDAEYKSSPLVELCQKLLWDVAQDIAKRNRIPVEDAIKQLKFVMTTLGKARNGKEVKILQELFRMNLNNISIILNGNYMYPFALAINRLTTQTVANLIINEAGEIDNGALNMCVDFIKKGQLERINRSLNLNTILPEDAYLKTILPLLEHVRDNHQMREELRKCKASTTNETAKELVRVAVGKAYNEEVTDADARRALLAAYLEPPRQTKMGNCFAEAYIIQAQQISPYRYMKVLNEIIMTGKLKVSIGINKAEETEKEIELTADASDVLYNEDLFNLRYEDVMSIYGFEQALLTVFETKKDVQNYVTKAIQTLSERSKKNAPVDVSAKDIIEISIAFRHLAHDEKVFRPKMDHARRMMNSLDKNPIASALEIGLASAESEGVKCEFEQAMSSHFFVMMEDKAHKAMFETVLKNSKTTLNRNQFFHEFSKVFAEDFFSKLTCGYDATDDIMYIKPKLECMPVLRSEAQSVFMPLVMDSFVHTLEKYVSMSLVLNLSKEVKTDMFRQLIANVAQSELKNELKYDPNNQRYVMFKNSRKCNVQSRFWYKDIVTSDFKVEKSFPSFEYFLDDLLTTAQTMSEGKDVPLVLSVPGSPGHVMLLDLSVASDNIKPALKEVDPEKRLSLIKQALDAVRDETKKYYEEGFASMSASITLGDTNYCKSAGGRRAIMDGDKIFWGLAYDPIKEEFYLSLTGGETGDFFRNDPVNEKIKAEWGIVFYLEVLTPYMSQVISRIK